MIKVLIVDDSLTFRAWLSEMFCRNPGFTVVGQAADGKAALTLLSTSTADVIVLDMMMPVQDGLQLTEQVMQTFPIPIVILSSSDTAGSNVKLEGAVKAGALTTFAKPNKTYAGEKWERDFLQTVRAASRVPVIKHRQVKKNPASIETAKISMIAIGASTGGPQTIGRIIKDLGNLPVPIVLVQHSPEGFSEQMHSWYASIAPMPVVTITDKFWLSDGKGKLLIAPPGKHLRLSQGALVLESSAPRNFCCPSVDVFFESLKPIGKEIVCILLTGMGRDGAQGMLEVKTAGGITIAQDEESCVVFGMPKAAIDLNAAKFVLPDHEIASTIQNILGLR